MLKIVLSSPESYQGEKFLGHRIVLEEHWNSCVAKMSPMTKHAMCACLWEGEGGAGDKELYCVCPSFDESYFLLIYIKIIIIVINILITLIANDYPSLLFTFFPTCLHTKVIKNKKNQIVYPSS